MEGHGTPNSSALEFPDLKVSPISLDIAGGTHYSFAKIDQRLESRGGRGDSEDYANMGIKE